MITFKDLIVGVCLNELGMFSASLESLSYAGSIEIEVEENYYFLIWTDPTDCPLTGGHYWVGFVHSQTGDLSNPQDRKRAVAIWRKVGRLFKELSEGFFLSGEKVFTTSTSDSRDKLYRRCGFKDTNWTRTEEIGGKEEERPILLFSIGEDELKT